jgi:hypothetical protein
MIGLLLVGALIFFPDGNFVYWQWWLLICILFIPMFIAGLVIGIPFDIPEKWKCVYFGSILNKLTDGTHRTPNCSTSGVNFV